jgi:hypothetical protein
VTLIITVKRVRGKRERREREFIIIMTAHDN